MGTEELHQAIGSKKKIDILVYLRARSELDESPVITEIIEEVGGSAWTIYAALEDMENIGIIRVSEKDRKAHNRREVKITEKGKIIADLVIIAGTILNLEDWESFWNSIMDKPIIEWKTKED